MPSRFCQTRRSEFSRLLWVALGFIGLIATTYGFDTAGRLNAIGFGDHAFSYGYLPKVLLEANNT